jgi:hypothetical protein
MERMFSGFRRRFAVFYQIPTSPREPALDPDRRRLLCAWLEEGSLRSATFRGFFWKACRKAILDLDVMVGESELFKEEDALAEHSSYNTIAKFRPATIQKLTEMLDDAKFADKVVDRMRGYSDATKDGLLSVDLTEVAVAAVATTLSMDSQLSARFAISERWTLQDQLPLMPGPETLHPDFPAIVQAFGAFGVMWEGTWTPAPDALALIALWVRTVCESPRLCGRLPDKGSGNILAIYRLLYPERADVADMSSRRLRDIPTIGDRLPMPGDATEKPLVRRKGVQ